MAKQHHQVENLVAVSEEEDTVEEEVVVEDVETDQLGNLHEVRGYE